MDKGDKAKKSGKKKRPKKKTKYGNNVIKIDNNRINIFLNDPRKIREKTGEKPRSKSRGKSGEKIGVKSKEKFNKITPSANKPRTKINKTAENRKKKLNINIISDSNNKNVNNTEENYYSPQKTEDNINYKHKDPNKDAILLKNLSNKAPKKNKIPKLNFNTKITKKNYPTERTANKAIDNTCSFCNKKCKKFLLCPKCIKNFCEPCIKKKNE